MIGSPAPVRVFVAAHGNGFMRDIAEWFVDAAGSTGRRSELVTDELPTADGSINLVVAPHEFFELYPAPRPDLQRAAAASICIGTEQPGTPWFRLTADACRRGLVSLDINPQGVRALRAEGIDARHVQLGAVESMRSASSDADRAGRATDVLFMGGLDDRRGAVLADLATRLCDRRSDLRLFKFDRPVSASTPGLVFGRDKYDVLANSKVLVNIHRDRADADAPQYFEWARMVEAMANRCVVLTEPAATYAPLIAGDHFVTAELDQFADALADLLDDDDRQAAIAERAHDAVFGPLRLDLALATELDRIERDVLDRIAAHVDSSRPERGAWHLGLSRVPPPVLLGPFAPYTALRRRAKRLALDDTDMIRRIETVTSMLATGVPDHHTVLSTPGWSELTSPRVSSVVTLYNYAGVVGETLDSLAASTGVEHEIIVVDDHSSDDGRAVVESFMHAHPDHAITMVAKDVNAGLATARNDGFALARGEYVFVIDADNHVYPTCLQRLAATLDEHPAAAAAYSILEDFGNQRNVRSALGWDPARLCAANYIDAQAMWRKRAWHELGGYRNDDRFVFGWEDWDLWLRLASTGGHAVLRREILGRYRVQDGSMISLTNLETAEAIDAMRTRYPGLPWV
jgi:hypothetical protein